MSPRLDADKFLEDLSGRHARVYFDRIRDMMEAVATGNRTKLLQARKSLNDVMRETMGAAEVLGASLVLQDVAQVVNEEGLALKGDRRLMIAFAEGPIQTIIPRSSFKQAVQSMVDRTPVTIKDAAQRTANAISQLYSEGQVTAFVRSAEEAVTERAKNMITELIRSGSDEVDIGRQIVKSVDEVRKLTDAWSESYARMAFRTNTNSAITAGRFRQLRDPKIKRIMPAVQFLSVGDVDTRPNHDAGDEIILRSDNPAWNRLAPVLGYG